MSPIRISVDITWPQRLSGTWLAAIWIECLWCLALIVPAGEAIWRSGAVGVQIFALSLLLSLAWELLFSHVRKRSISAYAVVTALAFATVAPAGAPLWQLALGLSFGIVIGVHIFGGYGWNFLNAVTVALGFLIFSFPSNNYGGMPLPSWQSCIPGALLLMVAGVISWRIVICAFAALTVFGAGLAGFQAMSPVVFLSLAFPLLFFGCDPLAAPATDPARWVYGIIIGLLAGLGLISGKGAAGSFVAAILLGGIFAPLLDHAAVQFHIWRREAGNG